MKIKPSAILEGFLYGGYTMTIQEIAKQLNDGIDRTDSERLLCEAMLTIYQQENNLTLQPLTDKCWEDSVEIFDYIFS